MICDELEVHQLAGLLLRLTFDDGMLLEDIDYLLVINQVVCLPGVLPDRH